jgi:hypothetical protein
MSEAQAQAQLARRQREREAKNQAANEAAGAAADAAAAAIPDDAPVEASTEDQQPKQRPSASDWRLQALEEMRGRPEDDEDVEKRLSDFTEPEAAVEATTEVTVKPVQPAAVTEPAKTIKAKVNGQEFDVPEAEIEESGGLTIWQKEKAADLRLERMKQEQAALMRQTQQLGQALQAMRQAVPAQEAPKSLFDLAKEKAPALQFGTPDESAAAISDIINAAMPKTDENQLIARAVDAFSRQRATEEFMEANKDISGNRNLLQFAVLREHAKLSQSKPSDWRKFYVDLAAEVRNDLGLPNPTASSVATTSAPNPTVSMADKDARKASITTLPVAGARVPAPEEPKPLTREDRLKLLQKARGQQA